MFRRKVAKIPFLSIFAFFCLGAISACGGNSSAVRVYDNAHVLNTSKVQSSANFSYPLDIYTTNTFTGDKSSFRSTTGNKLGGDPNRIVMAIDTNHHYMYIAKGSKVSLSSDQ